MWETCVPPRAAARVTHIEIDRVESPTFAGRSFGAVGQYEKIAGRAFGAVDPGATENAGIVNLELADTDSAGRVSYSTDFVILRPRDPTKGNRTLFYGVLNRGNKIDLVLLNDVPYGPSTNTPHTATDAGNGFLMRHGYTIVWSGWQARGTAGAQCCVLDEPGVMGAVLPVALENGVPLSGPVRDPVCRSPADRAADRQPELSCALNRPAPDAGQRPGQGARRAAAAHPGLRPARPGRALLAVCR